MPHTTSWRLRPALPLLLLSYLILAKFSWTIAIPTNNSSNESSNSGDVVVANFTDKRAQFDNISSEKFAEFKFHFNNDTSTEPSPAHIDDSEEQELCYSERKLIYPMTAMSKGSEWLTVAQSEKHKQGVFVEQCVRAEEKCRFDDSFPLAYTSSCVQRYTFRPMVVLVNDELKEELIKLPSHCKCVLKPRRKI